ncbi:MAG: hypothetical protein AAF266_10025 [Planctomycetota bacterium]
MPRLSPTLSFAFACLLAGIFLVSILVADAMVRISAGGAMPINGPPLDGTKVNGQWHPDFLWAGKAWQIEIETTQRVRLSLDDKDYVIPKGAHTLYSNHDHTNTGEYGDGNFWGYPANVTVRPVD